MSGELIERGAVFSAVTSHLQLWILRFGHFSRRVESRFRVRSSNWEAISARKILVHEMPIVPSPTDRHSLGQGRTDLITQRLQSLKLLFIIPEDPSPHNHLFLGQAGFLDLSYRTLETDFGSRDYHEIHNRYRFLRPGTNREQSLRFVPLQNQEAAPGRKIFGKKFLAQRKNMTGLQRSSVQEFSAKLKILLQVKNLHTGHKRETQPSQDS